MDWYPWIVLAHVVGAFGFVLAHGVSAFVAFQIRADRRPEHVRAMMELSSASMSLMYPSLLLLVLAGGAAAFARNLWGQLWLWLSIGVLLAVVVAMFLVATPFYIRVRHAVGLTAPQDKKCAPAPTPLSPADLAALLDSGRPHVLTLVGGLGVVILLWLMVVKPG